MSLSRYVHTLRHLRLRQFIYRARYLLPVLSPVPAPAPGRRELAEAWTPPVEKGRSLLRPDRFRFLNREAELVFPAAWNDGRSQRLWLYNLHYFDDLTAEGASERCAWHRDLIERWIRENPPGEGAGWEPYPISLRAVNWIKWAQAGNALDPDALESLAVQVRHMRRRLEFHLLGNHLWANAKALVFAGFFFEGPEADGWLQKGLAILEGELPEQILPDGGHFERSPMYHAILLEDLLDLANMQRAYGRPLPEGWKAAIGRMRRCLAAMQHPDGEIVLFNDAAFGIAAQPQALEEYARRLGFGGVEESDAPIIALEQTGYLRLKKGAADLFLDVAPVGPDYIPGHAHADTLNFELSLFGRRVIVDSGTSTYEKTAERQRQRGTAAHNTVTLDGEDSSEVWGGFRVARRARPLGIEIGEEGGVLRVSCAHDGYRRLPGKPVHRREWQLADAELSIRDVIEGRFREAISRYHFHPDVDVELTGDGEGKGLFPDGQSFSFDIRGGVARLVDTTYHPEFNVKLPNRCMEVVFNGSEAKIVFSWDGCS